MPTAKRTTKKTGTKKAESLRPLQRFALFFFDRPKSTFLIWIVLVVFGALSYTTFLKREGFPSINIPIAIVNGTYFANDPAKVDSDIAKPITDIALKQDGVSAVQSRSSGNFYSVFIQYDSSVDSHTAAVELEKIVSNEFRLPPTATAEFNVPYFGVTGGDAKKIDALISIYGTQGQTSAELVAPAQAAVEYLNAHKPSLVKEFFLRNSFETAKNPVNGMDLTIQKTFDRFASQTTSSTPSITIGTVGVDSVDVIKLDNQLKLALQDLSKQPSQAETRNIVSASSAPAIKGEIGELQKVLLEGLIAVLVIGSIVIAVRASFITVIAMLTVIMTSLGFLFLIGYSLNVITLFALILGLSLIVDDTIIMTEAIDAARRRNKDRREVIKIAVRKISRAMIAATLTATLSFAPLLFATGVLGSFIRAIPVTIIASLLISLLVALLFIPFFARVFLLGKKQLGEKGVKEIAATTEQRIALFIAKPMHWAKGSAKRLLGVGSVAVAISLIFIAAGVFIFTKVTFNIFPPTKDTNTLSISLNFEPGTTIAQSEKIARDADTLAAKMLGDDFVESSYEGNGNNTTAISYIELTPYDQRGPTSVELVKKLQGAFDAQFTEAAATVAQVDVGPPASGFTVEIRTENTTKAYKLASAVSAFLEKTTLTRVDGTTAEFKNVAVSSQDFLVRNDGSLSVNVSADFTDDDTTTLVTLAQREVNDEFTADTLASTYGLPKDAINFNLGQESDNQDSFKSLALAFPILLIAIYVLLVFEFRSFLQPLLIFIAIPFSLFGITLGLYLTNNAFSFFAMLGFFALIGLSLKNTILLTDYANQSRRDGNGPVDAAVDALKERFRPLIATSLTAVVSLIPLALTSPFWQGLAVVLIFGLISSTFLVITVFPYYYLAGEAMRAFGHRRIAAPIRRRFGRTK